MKKTIALTLILTTLLCMFGPLDAFADTSGYYTYTVSDGKATITNCDTSISGNVIIPSTLGGYPVTSIGASAFKDCTKLASITIPNSVLDIGNSAFYGCKNLTNITITDSVTSIGDWAFGECTSLTTITIPNSVTTIGRAFEGCTSLTTITIPDSVTHIDDRAFYKCTSLTNIIVDKDNKYYSSDANGILYNKNKSRLVQYPVGKVTTTMTIPDSVTNIGNGVITLTIHIGFGIM